MAKGKRNSGKFKQDAILGQFSRDAKVGGNTSTIAQALAQGQKKAAYVAKQEAPVRVSFKFLATGK